MSNSDSAHILSYLEFYSGIGGWTMALEEACCQINQFALKTGKTKMLSPKCLSSFDHSDLCNKVYEYNFTDDKETGCCSLDEFLRKTNGKEGTIDRQPKKSIAIERLTQKKLQNLNAFIWMMSPPCQPYTRQHNKQQEDLLDPRTKSFLHLCEILHAMEFVTLPKIILMENVVGFETSSSCQRWRNVLKSRNYCVTHFHLNPTQVLIPNDRPRYYCLAILGLSLESHGNRGPLGKSEALISWFLSKQDINDQWVKSQNIHTNINPLGVKEEHDVKETELESISHFLDHSNDDITTAADRLFVSKKKLDSTASWCFDIVTPLDRRSACFTQSYGNFIRGTGSVLFLDKYSTPNVLQDGLLESTKKKRFKFSSVSEADRFKLVPAHERVFDRKWSDGIDLENRLRYFSGMEIARLMGFPVLFMAQMSHSSTHSGLCVKKHFSFPPDVSIKQQWKLLGNSLNVKVAAKLVELSISLGLNI